MLALTGRPLLIMTWIAAVVLPVTILVLWSKASWPGRLHQPHQGGSQDGSQPDAPAPKATSKPRFLLMTSSRVLLIIASHLAVLLLVGLLINNAPENRFYSTWKDLLTEFNHNTKPAEIPLALNITALDAGSGSVEKRTIDGHDVLVWLPPGYHDQSAATTHYPVVMFLPGQPSQPTTVFNQYNFGRLASQAISEGKIPPFIGVFPPIMIAAPVDTECTDIPSGPQAETWLAHVVPQQIGHQYRTQPGGRHWSVMGWSTGGFCSTKLALKHPTLFGSAVSFGGHLIPWGKKEDALQRLFKGNATLMTQNTPLEIYRTQGTRGAHLLLISGEQDHSTWPQVKQLRAMAPGDTSVTVVPFQEGGHNYKNYRAYLPAAFQWVGATVFRP